MKKFILFIFITALTVNIQAQDDGFYSSTPYNNPKELKKMERQKKFEKWTFGGAFWLSIGSTTQIEISPLAFYQAAPKLKVGTGFTYMYYKYNNPFYYEGSIYGPRAAVIYTLFSDLEEKININIGNIVLQGEYEYLNADEVNSNNYLTGSKVWVSNFLLGGGIFQPFMNKGGIYFVVLYNFLENSNSVLTTSNPVVRLGFYF
jgi:hypothetical protein